MKDRNLEERKRETKMGIKRSEEKEIIDIEKINQEVYGNYFKDNKEFGLIKFVLVFPVDLDPLR